ncbi:MAG: hypothetical protein Q9221_002203 [Calogaya cf. arnoldii]
MAVSMPLQLPFALFLLLSAFITVMAQEISSSNDPLRDSHDVVLTTHRANMDSNYPIDPLTDRAREVKDTLGGFLVSTNPVNVTSLQPSDIAYLSCDHGAYPANLNATQTFQSALARSPKSIILFSVNATRCVISPNSNLEGTTVYSMKDSSSSTELLGYIQNSMLRGTSSIKARDDGGGGGGILGRSPTTAVAMIILYSITGIITALFLLIIVVGAIRAHRHPERYGPRNIVGRARQSRAKGIARAMLETIPIVKFGDNDVPKTADPTTAPERDIEMAPPQTVAPENSTQAQHSTTTATSTAPNEHIETNKSTITPEPAIAEATNPQITDDPMANADNGLACSVCTDDFTKGQDVRVLPCNHKFHPECIDPWLLNVSGTCPLCRIDLRPTRSNENPEPDHTVTVSPPQSRRNSEALTSFNPSTQQNQSRRNSRARPLHYLHHYLNRGRMEEATPQERLEALRRLRLVNRSDIDYAASHQDAQNANGDATGAGGGRNRLSTRLSRAFGGDRSRPVSGVSNMPPPTPTVPEARDVTEEATADDARTVQVPAVPTVAGPSNTAREGGT